MKSVKARVAVPIYAVMFLYGAHLVFWQSMPAPVFFFRVVGYIFLTVGGFALALLAWASYVAKRSAKRFMELRKARFTRGDFECRLVDPAEFPHLDREFYDRARTWFESQGFRFLCDCESPTLSQFSLLQPTFFRTMLSPDGTILGGAVHFQLGPLRAARVVRRFGLPPNLKIIEFETELSDGTFMATSNTPDRELPVPGIDVLRLPAETTPDDLLRVHRERLSAVLKARPSVTPTRVETMEEATGSQQRLYALIAKHARSIGYATAADIEKLVGRPLNWMEQQVAEEVDKLSKLERRAAEVT
jgi:hypothetical protein